MTYDTLYSRFRANNLGSCARSVLVCGTLSSSQSGNTFSCVWQHSQ